MTENQMLPFPSIEQYRNVIRTVNERAKRYGAPVPSLKFHGTVKLHGTNAAIVSNLATGQVWTQSRTQIITPENDNAGFAQFVSNEQAAFMDLLPTASRVAGEFGYNSGSETLAIYGEWCGGNIHGRRRRNGQTLAGAC